MGYKNIVGLDEVGVGPLAGPVTACAFVCADWRIWRELQGIRDSKLLSEKQREHFYSILVDMKNRGKADFAVASSLPRTVDKINIRNATVRAMRTAVKKLSTKPDCAVIDRFAYRGPILHTPHSILVPQADRRVASVAAASIIAKVTRDRTMVRYHKKYPEYRFDRHKGYGTKLHKEMLARHGLCPIHRKTFTPHPAGFTKFLKSV